MTETPKHAATPQPIAWLTPAVRRWLYGIATALVPILVIYGVIESETAPMWIALVASMLGTGTALAHVPGENS